MPPPKFNAKITDSATLTSLTSYFEWLKADAIVTKTASSTHAKEGELAELTSFNLPPGSWLIAGQGSFSVNGSNDSYIEYKLFLQYESNNVKTNGQHSYMRLIGGWFGSPIVIDAVVFDQVTTVKLLYLTQSFSTPESYSPSTQVRDQILIAIKTPNLLVY